MREAPSVEEANSIWGDEIDIIGVAWSGDERTYLDFIDEGGLTFPQIDDTGGEVYVGCAEHDDLAPLEMVDELRTLFDGSGANGELEMYPGVHHGFAFPQRWCYDRPAAERHWERLHDLFGRSLHS